MNEQSEAYAALARISASIEGDYHNEDDKWADSPFAWIKTRPSRQIGAIGEKLVSSWLESHGFNVSRSPDSDADRLVNGRRVEIKFSTLWQNGSYKFQQVRDQNYELVICLGISPSNAHCWVIPKEDILRLWNNEHVIQSQHGGREGSDTAWISVAVDNQPDWLKSYGGTLEEAIKILTKLLDHNRG